MEHWSRGDKEVGAHALGTVAARVEHFLFPSVWQQSKEPKLLSLIFKLVPGLILCAHSTSHWGPEAC